MLTTRVSFFSHSKRNYLENVVNDELLNIDVWLRYNKLSVEILDIFQVSTSLDTAKFTVSFATTIICSLHSSSILLMTNSQVHRYDTRTASNYRVHSCRTNIKKFTILYQGPRIWNCLPASVTNLSSFSIFKNKVLEFLLK